MRKIGIDLNNTTSERPAAPVLPDTRQSLQTRVGRDVQPDRAAAKSNGANAKPRRRWGRWLLILLVGVVVVGGVVFAVSRWQRQLANSINSSGENGAPACVDILNPACWTQAFTPTLDQVNGKTNALVVGIDTRASGSGAGLANTDTIILMTFDHNTGATRMISFPRDLYAPYSYTDGGAVYRAKINSIYAAGRLYSPTKDGMEVLKRTIEKISGEKIQYTGIIKLEGVVKAVDALGGVTVQVPKDHTDLYPYIELSERYQKTCKRHATYRAYCLFTFKAGPTEMDGETALIYARMRYLSSDFDRGRRQQEVINAAKDKVLGDTTPTLDKARNLLSLYSNLSQFVEVKIDLEMVLAGLALVDKADKNPVQIVMDPTFGGGGVVIKGEGSNFNFKDYTFKQVQDKLKVISDNNDLYRDAPTILVENYTGANLAADEPMVKLKGLGLWFINTTITNKTKVADTYGVEIIDYTGGKKSLTVERLQKEYAARSAEVRVITASEENGLKASAKGEHILVKVFPVTPAPVVTPTPTTGAQ